jgi:hypothetical protein
MTRTEGFRYFNRSGCVPRKVREGEHVAHNPVVPLELDQPHGRRGFRIMFVTPAWLAKNPHFKPCRCGWAEHLGVHYSPLRSRSRKAIDAIRKQAPR